MSRKDMQRANLEISLSHPEKNWDSDTVSELVLNDRTSNKRIAVIELTLQDFHNLLANRSRGDLQGVAYLAKPSDLAKLRHKRVTITRTMPKLPWTEDRTAKLEQWATEAAAWLGSDEASVNTSNTGTVTVSVRLYVAPVDADKPDRLEEFRQRMTRQLESVSLRMLGVEEEGQ